MSVSSAARRAAALQLVLVLLGLLLVPLALRMANRVRGVPQLGPSYLSSIEGPRERRPFDAGPLKEMARQQPGFVVIGDSMAGSRIEPALLSHLTGQTVFPLFLAGSGSAWWYLALKNWVIGGHAHPKCTFIFFRDTNLTDPFFRVEGQYRWSLDQVARDREDEVNAVFGKRAGGPLYSIRSAVDRAYEVSPARDWIEPAVNDAPGRVMFAYRRTREIFMTQLNERFGLTHLRQMDAADLQASEDREADFDRFVDDSFLPLMLRDAANANVPLCFVRVQRRPEGGRPPVQTSAMRRYIAKLRAYIEAHGARFHDDTGDPQLTLDMYEDGDHLSRDGRVRYTQLFFDRMRPLFP
jgi:hypothetical protein